VYHAARSLGQSYGLLSIGAGPFHHIGLLDKHVVRPSPSFAATQGLLKALNTVNLANVHWLIAVSSQLHKVLHYKPEGRRADNICLWDLEPSHNENCCLEVAAAAIRVSEGSFSILGPRTIGDPPRFTSALRELNHCCCLRYPNVSFPSSLQAHASKLQPSRTFERPGGQACCCRSCGRSRCGETALVQARCDNNTCPKRRLPPRLGYALLCFRILGMKPLLCFSFCLVP
jgi:hypothetical protein